MIKDIVTLKGVKIYSGCDSSIFQELYSSCHIRLPASHEDLLISSNGIETFFGYFRLFGLSTTLTIDALLWNQEDYWKFSWGDKCKEYWCFGETVWGDQYAYLLNDLFNGKECVYILDAYSMNGEKISENFNDFFFSEFLRNAKHPYDQMILTAFKKFGSLYSDQHLVYAPSLLLGGIEELSKIERMNARSAMICNGDIASQIEQGPPKGRVIQVSSYIDDKGRSRLQLVWK